MTDPFDHGLTPELFETLSRPIGHIMIHWPFIEEQLAAITAITADVVEASGAKVRRDYNYSDRMKYVRPLFANVPALKKHRHRADHVFAGVERFAELRHDVAHGRITGYDAASRVLTLTKVKPDKSKAFHRVKEFPLPVDDIENAAADALTIVGDLSQLSKILMREFLPDAPFAGTGQ